MDSFYNVIRNQMGIRENGQTYGFKATKFKAGLSRDYIFYIIDRCALRVATAVLEVTGNKR